MRDLSNTRLDRYHIIRRLQESASAGYDADRYEAYDTRPLHEGNVMLFVVSDRLTQRPNFAKSFTAAMSKAIRLDDPSIIKVIDFGVREEGRLCYVVTELLTGLTLREIVEKLAQNEQALCIPDILEIVQQVCGAVELIRINRMLPPDLSRDNILDNILLARVQYDWGAVYQVSLTDLGLASLVDNGATLHARDAVTALGSLLYRLIIGEDEFTKQPDMQDVTPISVIYPTFPEQAVRVVTAIERIIQTTLALQGFERFDNTGLLAADLNRLLPLARRYANFSLQAGKPIDLAMWLVRPLLIVDSSAALQLPATRPETGSPDTAPIVIGNMPGEVRVEPGMASPPVVIEVKNDSTRDLEVDIDVQSDDPFERNWWRVTPGSVRLDSKERANAVGRFVLIVQPPSRARRYRLQVVARYRAGGWIVSDRRDLPLVVSRTPDYDIEVWPRALRAGESGVVTVTNRGNAPETVELSWLGKENDLYFGVEQKRRDRVTLLVDAGDTGSVEFFAWPRRPHWFGRPRNHPFTVSATTQNRREPKTFDGQVQSRRLIPLWLILLSCVLLLAAFGWSLWLMRPVVASADNCPMDVNVSVPSVAICVNFQPGNVEEVEILPGNHLLDLKSKSSVFAAPAPDQPANTVKVVANNWLSRILPLLAYRETLLVPVHRPAPTPTPAPRLLDFCVANPAKPDMAPVCRADCTDCPPAVLSLTRGEVENLAFTWCTEHLEGYMPELTPKTVEFTVEGNSATAPAPAVPTTYTLTLIDNMGNRLPPLAVQVDVKTITAIVTEPELYLRQSPGRVYQTLGILTAGTPLVLLTQPIDYQQNEDLLHWVLVTVQNTGEQGWVACEGLDNGRLCPLQGASGDGSAVALGEYVQAGDPIPQVAGGGANGSVGGQAAPAGSTTSGGQTTVAAGAAGGLPAVLPAFGPTVTPTPTETPTLTPTPLPTPTPTVTIEPLRIEIYVSPATVVYRECVLVEWNIVGVKEVYFNYAQDRDDLEPVFDNRARSLQFCDGDYKVRDPNESYRPKEHEDDDNSPNFLKHYILFYWRVVLLDGSARDEYRIVFVDDYFP